MFFDLPLDFETYYDTASGYTLSKMTAEEYIRDPRFQIIGLGIRWPGSQTEWLTNMTHAEMGAYLRGQDWSDKIAIGHNLSEFDALILTHHLGIRPRFYQCTLALARQLHGSDVGKSLAKLCTLYGLPPKGNAVHNFDGYRLEDFTPAELAAYGDYCINDVDRCYDLYNLFKKRLPACELQYAHLLARMWAEPRLELDRELLELLAADLGARKVASLQHVCQLLSIPFETAQDVLRSDAKFAAALQSLGIDPPRKISKRTGKEAYAFAKTDRAMEELAEHEDDEVQALVAARLGVKTTIMESRVARFSGIAERGLLPVPIAYGKTVTSRASGSGRINMQNMGRNKPPASKTPKGTLLVTPNGIERLAQVSPDGKQLKTQTNVIHLVDDCHIAGLRDTIRAPEGKLIVVADSSNIELRVAHLLAGQMDTIAELRKGTDLYSWFATDLYGYPVNKKTHPKERQHGKVGMLQLQYQSGAGSFKNAARVMGGVILTDDESEKTVQVYRQRFPKLPEFWRTCGNAIEDMFNGRMRQIDQWGLCVTAKDTIVLPSGRHMEYHNLRKEINADGRDEWRYDDKEKRYAKKLYGGQLLENLSQTLARDVVFEQTLEAEKRWGNYRASGNGVVLSAHDEAVLVADEDEAEECLAWVVACMSQSPRWWPQLPVAAEGGVGVYYGDAKG